VEDPLALLDPVVEEPEVPWLFDPEGDETEALSADDCGGVEPGLGLVPGVVPDPPGLGSVFPPGPVGVLPVFPPLLPLPPPPVLLGSVPAPPLPLEGSDGLVLGGGV